LKQTKLFWQLFRLQKSEKIAPAESLVKQMSGSAARFFNDYHLLHFPGEISGYIIETGEKEKFGNLENFHTLLKKNTRVNFSNNLKTPEVEYLSLAGEKLKMRYIPEKLRCEAEINGEKTIGTILPMALFMITFCESKEWQNGNQQRHAGLFGEI
jgi:hypothetical protein